MSTTGSLDHSANKVGFTEEHGIAPGWGGLVLGMVGLLLIVLGDFASFNFALSRSFQSMGPSIVLMLTLAMSAAAVWLTFEAGRAEARRRARNAGRTGRGAVSARIGTWLLLGLTTFVVRMTAPPENTDLSTGFALSTPSSASGGLGSAAGEGTDSTGIGTTATDASGGPIQFGPVTWFAENFTAALMMFAVFVAGGVGAYYLGKESHNPLITELRRAKMNHWWARRRLGKAQAKLAASQRDAHKLATALEQHEKATGDLFVVSDLEHNIDLYETAIATRIGLRATLNGLDAGIASAQAELSSIPAQGRLTPSEAQLVGRKAKELARVQIAGYRGEPAATSGLTNGAQR